MENFKEIDLRCLKIYNIKVKTSQVTYKNKGSSEEESGYLKNPYITNQSFTNPQKDN